MLNSISKCANLWYFTKLVLKCCFGLICLICIVHAMQISNSPPSSNQSTNENELIKDYENIIEGVVNSDITNDGWKQVAVELKLIHEMKRGTFEKTALFKERQKEAIRTLEEKINIAAEKADPMYQAGKVAMTDYDPDKELLTVEISWDTEVTKLLAGTAKIQKGIIQIEPTLAKASFGKQAEQRMFVTVQWNEQTLILKQFFILIQGKQLNIKNVTDVDDSNKINTLKTLEKEIPNEKLITETFIESKKALNIELNELHERLQKTNSSVSYSFRDCPYCPKMVWVPAKHNFMIGSSNNEYGHQGNEAHRNGIQIKKFASLR